MAANVTLLDLRTDILRRTHMENSQVVQPTELNYYINKSGSEINGILAAAFGSKYNLKKQLFSVRGNTDTYPLDLTITFNTGVSPFGLNLVVTGATSGAKGTIRYITGNTAAGTLAFSDVSGTFTPGETITDTGGGSALYVSGNGGIGAADFLNLQALDLLSGGRPFPVREFKLAERALYQLPSANLSVYGAPFAYRFQGANLVFAPVPVAAFQLQMLYTPTWKVLVADTDVVDAVDGWDELIVLDGCIKVLAKQDLPLDIFVAQKNAMLKRIEDLKQQRNVAEPPRIVDVQEQRGWDSTYGRFGF